MKRPLPLGEGGGEGYASARDNNTHAGRQETPGESPGVSWRNAITEALAEERHYS